MTQIRASSTAATIKDACMTQFRSDGLLLLGRNGPIAEGKVTQKKLFFKLDLQGNPYNFTITLLSVITA